MNENTYRLLVSVAVLLNQEGLGNLGQVLPVVVLREEEDKNARDNRGHEEREHVAGQHGEVVSESGDVDGADRQAKGTAHNGGRRDGQPADHGAGKACARACVWSVVSRLRNQGWSRLQNRAWVWVRFTCMHASVSQVCPRNRQSHSQQGWRPTCNSTADSRNSGAAPPGDGEGDGAHGAADEVAHGKVHPAERDLELKENDGKAAGDDAPNSNRDACDEDDALAVHVGLDVALPDIVGEERGDRNLLSGSRGCNSHENLEGDEEGAAGAEQVHGDGGGDEALVGLVDGDGKIEGAGGESECGGHGEGDREPGDAAEEVALRKQDIR
jgi:hypothetical protein